MQRNTRFMWALAVPVALTAGAAQAVPFSDNFEGETLDTSMWATAGGTIGLDGAGNLLLESSTGSHSGATVATQASDLNFFDQALTFQISGLEFGGMGRETQHADYAMGYLAVGLANPNDTWAYNPTGADPNGIKEGIVLAVRVPGDNADYELLINQFHEGSNTGNSLAFGLSDLPTGISLTLDGSAGGYVVSLEGATFSWGGDEGNTATRSASLRSELTESVFVQEGSYITRMAFGAYNFGGVDEASTLTVGSASVIPEPGSLALLGLGGLAFLRRGRTQAATQ